ncbi:hypothetical protein GJ744_007827 [Endocarpon pusillum]|uniref:Uncharacterized protein n=1 Tax=Endocarpon pusillum TaxID=364733 RepID=A0A8H7EBH2_9EURO|nr:hypothetical protein GJ744_007827 [Endocarpon pusillum]
MVQPQRNIILNSCGCGIAHNGNQIYTAPIGQHFLSDAYHPVARDKYNNTHSVSRGGEYLKKDQPTIVVGKVVTESAFAIIVLVVAASAVKENQPVVAALLKITRFVSPAGTKQAEKRRGLLFDHQLSVAAAPFRVRSR